MKSIHRFFAIVITIAVIAACSSSTSTDNPSRIGTWRIDSQTHATWEGTDGVGSIRAARYGAPADSTSPPDTTYFYDNGQIQAEITPIPKNVYDGDFELIITDQRLNADTLSALKWHKTVVENLSSAFQVVEERGTRATLDKVTFKFQTNFNCQSSDNTDKDLRLAFLKFKPDSVAVADTLFYYQLSTEGMYGAARHIVCEN